MKRERPLILTGLGSYWPGNDASGPNQSFRALAHALQADFDFHLLAHDRPPGAASPLPASEQLADFTATYLPPGRLAPQGLLATVRRSEPDMLWLNGFFDRRFTLPLLLQRRLGRLPDIPVLLSPRGEFNRGALMLKATRKRSFISLAKTTGLLQGVVLHATDPAEAEAIRNALGRETRIMVAPNIRPLLEPLPHITDPTLRLVFLGRITPIKNLAFALRVLQDVRTPVRFDIHGPVEDEDHWRMCQMMAAELPAHVQVTHHGAYPNAALPDLLSRADLLLLPSAGENFGHAIFEALSCRVPVLISDRTPWRNLAAAQAGWDLPLEQPEAFAQRIDAFAAMDEGARMTWRLGARQRAESYVVESAAVEESRRMLRDLPA